MPNCLVTIGLYLYRMAERLEGFLLHLLDILPISSQNRGQTRRFYYEKRKIFTDGWRQLHKQVPAYYKDV